ncbi:MAG: phosphoglucosamine mutase [Candidatus Hydrogenedentota bacterium]
MSLILGPSGARGIVGESFTPDIVNDLVRAFLKTVRITENKTIVIGRDTRNTSLNFSKIISSVISLCGFDVIDIGMAPTPCVQFAVEYYKSASGIVISASHNPPEWNGLKFIKDDGTFFDEKLIAKLSNYLKNKDTLKWANNKSRGDFRVDNTWVDKYISKIKKIVNLKNIKKKRFRVFLDANGGAGACIGIKLLKELGCDVSGSGLYMDGEFLHPLEPSAENLKITSNIIRQGEYDVGFAQDTDADRLVLISEKGEVPQEDMTLALCVRNVLSKENENRAVVTNLSTSYIVRDEVLKYKGKIYYSKVGEVFVVSMMKNKRACIGGEGNGGVIHPAMHYGRDSFISMALILELMAKEDKPLSQIFKSVKKYRTLKKKIKLKEKNQFNRIKKTIKLIPGERLDTRDGIKIYTSSYWLHIRPSNTEPIIRIIAESCDEKNLKLLLKRINF